jgi:hypothetical protein
MNITEHPWNWPEVTEQDFEEFLETCPDYTRDAWSNGAHYEWRHNGDRFAQILGNKIFVDPTLLVPK